MRTNVKHEAASRIAPRARSLVGVLVAALICTGASFAQSSVALSPAPIAKPVAAVANVASEPDAKVPVSPTAKTPSRGPHEVTTVHGYWIIEVRNADGKVAKHMEFENQLCTSWSADYGNALGGDSTLSSLLAGTASAGVWSIVLGAPPTGVTNPPNCDIQPYFYLSQSGVCCAVGLNPFSNSKTAVPPWGAPGPLTGSVASSNTLAPYLASAVMPAVVESPAPAGQVGINLSAQIFIGPGLPPQGLTISAVGTQLFTCGGAVPRPGDCKNIGVYSSTLAQQGTPCTISSSALQGTPESQITTNWTGCIPGDPSTNTVTMTTYSINFDVGQNPFSGVVLTGTGGIPGPFTVSGGQTVAINWTLTFQ